MNPSLGVLFDKPLTKAQMFNLAGFETTSTTLSFTIPYLAANPTLQDWVREEVDSVSRNGKLTSYEDAFPLLPRTLSLMACIPTPHLSPPTDKPSTRSSASTPQSPPYLAYPPQPTPSTSHYIPHHLQHTAHSPSHPTQCYRSISTPYISSPPSGAKTQTNTNPNAGSRGSQSLPIQAPELGIVRNTARLVYWVNGLKPSRRL